MIAEDAGPSGLPHLLSMISLTRNLPDDISGFPNASVSQHFFSHLECRGNIVIVRGEITASIAWKLNIPEFQVASQTSMFIPALIQAEQDLAIPQIIVKLGFAQWPPGLSSD